MKINIRELLFWIILIFALALLLWNVFGKSPTEFVTIISIIFMLVLKIWSISDQQIKSDINAKNSFSNIREETSTIKYDIGLIKNKLKV